MEEGSMKPLVFVWIQEKSPAEYQDAINKAFADNGITSSMQLVVFEEKQVVNRYACSMVFNVNDPFKLNL